MPKPLDLTNQRFGRLIARKPTNKRYYRYVIWLCICDCGNTCLVSSGSLTSGNTRSCGCIKQERTVKMGKANKTHGMCKTLEWEVWHAMIQRCENPNHAAYARYGGRGIKVCERWHKFENFYEDMGDRPEGLTLERRNNEKGYYPENCYWATQKEQSNNRRPLSCGPNKQHWFIAINPNGKKVRSISQHKFALQYGMASSNISKCLSGRRKSHKGWTFQRIPE